MKARLQRVKVPPGSLTIRAVTALKALGRGEPDPILLGYHPTAQGNPFQALLYRRAWDARVATLPVPDEAQIAELLELARLGHKVVLHLHWLNRPLQRATSAQDAALAGDAFLETIAGVQAAGGRVVWTVHNLLPHAARFEEEECRFRGEVAKRADLIHIMAEETPALVAPYFHLPTDRLLHVPHPSYFGAYADIISRGQARMELGIMPDELVYLVLGAIQPYKGILELLDAWEALPDDGGPRRLVIAGAPSGEASVETVLERATLHPSVLLFDERIESDRMQIFLRAADVAVLPYLRTLNSGAQLLALTFGIPVIVPDGGGLHAILEPGAGRTFEPGDAGSLVAALAGAPELATQDAREAALRIARRFNPDAVSTRFVDGVRERLIWD